MLHRRLGSLIVGLTSSPFLPFTAGLGISGLVVRFLFIISVVGGRGAPCFALPSLRSGARVLVFDRPFRINVVGDSMGAKLIYSLCHALATLYSLLRRKCFFGPDTHASFKISCYVALCAFCFATIYVTNDRYENFVSSLLTPADGGHKKLPETFNIRRTPLEWLSAMVNLRMQVSVEDS